MEEFFIIGGMENKAYNFTEVEIKKLTNKKIGQEVALELERPEMECKLDELGKIELVKINNAKDANYVLWKTYIERYHYLKHGKLYGKQIRYLLKSERIGWIGALSFSSAAWRLKARENWIGWNEENRLRYLNRIICNSRFLIVPWLKVKNLASFVLSMSMQQVKKDWVEQYKMEPVLVETFVEKERFLGTCYRAANFHHIGITQGRGRQDRENKRMVAIKDIYVYPFCSDVSNVLCIGQPQQIVEEKSFDWAEEEFGAVNFGDWRLTNRLLSITRDFFAKPQANIPQACQTRAKTKAAYRFLDNTAVCKEAILNAHYESTIKRSEKEKIVLAVQDTTSLNYSMHPATENLGPISSRGDGIIGLMVHDTMAFNPEGTPLGLLDVQCWARDPEEEGKRQKRHSLPIEEKESNKWLVSFKATAEAQRQCKKTTFVSIGDREADIYELFELALKNPTYPKLLIRAEHNRSLSEEQDRIWEYMGNCSISGIQRMRISRRGNQPSREVELAIRYACVELKAPRRKQDKANIKVWVVLAREENIVPSIKPLEWMLITTLEVGTFEQAVEKIEWYTKRWGIEIFHKTLKSGCKIEQRQLGSADRIEACLAIDMVVAWRIYYLTKLGREVPDVPCTVFFEEAEWKALVAFKTKDPIAPLHPPSLREAVRMVASLGGFLGRKGDGEPGTKTLWLGIQRLDDITDTWKIFAAYSSAPP